MPFLTSFPHLISVIYQQGMRNSAEQTVRIYYFSKVLNILSHKTHSSPLLSRSPRTLRRISSMMILTNKFGLSSVVLCQCSYINMLIKRYGFKAENIMFFLTVQIEDSHRIYIWKVKLLLKKTFILSSKKCGSQYLVSYQFSLDFSCLLPIQHVCIEIMMQYQKLNIQNGQQLKICFVQEEILILFHSTPLLKLLLRREKYEVLHQVLKLTVTLHHR